MNAARKLKTLLAASLVALSLSATAARAQIGGAERPATKVASLRLSPSTVTAGQPFEIKVRLDGVAPAEGIALNLTSDHPALRLEPTLTVPAGRNEVTLMVEPSQVLRRTRGTLTVSWGDSAKRAALTGGAGQPGVTLAISDSRLEHNQAIGGNRNQSGYAYGGGIVDSNGPATITGCTLDHNQAIGGAGGLGGIGGRGIGGGLSMGNSAGRGTNVTVSKSTVDENLALGGEAGPGGSGGDGWGGGIATADLGTTLTANGTTVGHNLALGGAGGAGGNGGSGLGGGLYDGVSSTIALAGATVSDNVTLGGGAGAGGSAGQGVGGGVYRLGTFSFDSTTVVEKNHASTSNDDLGPVSAQ